MSEVSGRHGVEQANGSDWRQARKRRGPIALSVGALVVVAFVLIALPNAFARDRMPLFLLGDGAAVRLRTAAEARAVLERMSAIREAQSVAVACGRDTTTTTFADAGVSIDVEGTLRAIDGVRRRGGVLGALKFGVRFYLPQAVDVRVRVDDARFASFLRRLEDAWSVAPVDAALVIDEQGVATVTPAADGRAVPAALLRTALARAFARASKRVDVAPVTVRPAIDDAKAREALREFVEWSAKRLSLVRGSESVTLEGRALARRLMAVREGETLRLAVSAPRLAPLLDAYFGDQGRKPVDARFEVDGDTVRIVPGVPGFMPDATATAAAATEALRGSGAATVEVEFASREPSVTVERARAMGIRERIGTYTTTYNPRQTNRVENIKLLARLLDDQLVAPGEVFSFNERIGPRSLERGFKLAPTIVNGELVDTAGGGACQVGTTLFNCAFFAGLEIVERHNHSFYISHYPAGRDATVSYGGYDLRFRNDTGHWIVIKAVATQSRITISFYGTGDGRRVEYETGPFTNFKPFSTKYVDDPALYVGQTKVEEEGIAGRRVVVRRRVYRADGTLLHSDAFTSVYRPKVELVRRGTKPRPVETTSTASTPTP